MSIFCILGTRSRLSKHVTDLLRCELAINESKLTPIMPHGWLDGWRPHRYQKTLASLMNIHTYMIICDHIMSSATFRVHLLGVWGYRYQETIPSTSSPSQLDHWMKNSLELSLCFLSIYIKSNMPTGPLSIQPIELI